MYRITKHSLDQAKKFGVELVQSSNPKKKIDVFKDGKKLASIGATGFGDYGTFLISKGKAFADERRRLYKIRHNKTMKVLGSNSWWADKILW